MVNIKELKKQADSTIEKVKIELIKKLPFKQNIIVAGSSSDEWTIFNNYVLSDADMFIMSNTSFLFIKRMKEVQKKYDSNDLKITIDPATFWGMKKDYSFLAFELKSKGEVIHGDKNILKKVRVTQKTLPKWEGIREMFLRLKFLKKSENIKEIKYYQIVKCYLGILNTFLVFNENYKPSFRERYEEFKKIKFKDKKLKRKIQLSFNFKFNKIKQKDINELINLEECERLLLKYINHFLGNYLNVSGDIKTKFQRLHKEFPIKLYRNLLFIYSVPRKYKPKYLKLIIFNPIILPACLVFKNFDFLKKYFKRLPKNYDELYEIIQTYPSLVVEKDFNNN